MKTCQGLLNYAGAKGAWLEVSRDAESDGVSPRCDDVVAVCVAHDEMSAAARI